MVSIDQIAKIRQRRVEKPNIVKLKKPPIWHFPSSQEREYMRVLFSLTNELKEHGVEIAFDNIDFSQLDIKTLIETKPIQYKINIEDIKEILRDKQNLTYAKNLILA